MLRRAVALVATGSVAAWTVAANSDHPNTVVRLVRDVVTLGRIVSVYTAVLPTESSASPVEQDRRDHRAANLLLELCRNNGGVYIKLGQMVAVLNPLVPQPYADVLSVLFDEAPQSSLDDVHRILETELGSPVEEIFTDFSPEPIASASLAQVHVATLRDSNKQVAVKVQHSTVPASAEIDLATIAILLRGVRWMFPTVDYAWLAEESKRNLPLELDFLHEAGNAKRCSDNFAHRSDIVVPHVYREYSTKRVLTMSFEDGVSPTDATAVEDRGLSRYAVANVIASALNEQIFIHGFVHADPHPGNLLVRSSKSEDTWGRWLLSPLRKALGIHTTRRPELVILDHGLYREVSDELRVSYAKFWKAILNGDKDAMRACTGPLGAGDLYPLLACVLTRKPWDVIVPVGNGEEASSFDSNSVRLVVTGDPREISTLQGHFREYISQTFAMLAKVNPDLLLLLKTNDCIHHVLSALGSPSLYYLWVSRWTTEALRVAIHSHDDRTCMRTWALDQITGWLTALVEAVL